MKRIFILPALMLLAACGGHREQKADQTTVQTTVIPAPPREKAAPSEKELLKGYFIKWRDEELREHRMWATDSCSFAWLEKHSYDDEVMMGFPDSTDFAFSYGDLNNDGKLDQLVTFNPVQCDGGNASMWMQTAVLTLSGKAGYETSTDETNETLKGLADDPESGIIHFDSIGVNRIYTTRFVFGENDGHCCPGTIMQVIFDYSTKQAIFKGPNTASY